MSKATETTRKDGKPKGAPLAKGTPRAMADARCAWRKMDAEQRAAFLVDVIGGERELSHGDAEYIVPAVVLEV